MSQSPKMLSVAFLYDDTLDSNDGVSQYVKTLGAWLSKQGHTVSYLTGQTQMSDWCGGKVYSLSKNIRVRFNANRLSVPLPASVSKIRGALSNNFDVVHVQMPYSPFMAGRVISRLSSSTALLGTFHILPAGKLATIGSRLLGAINGRSQKRIDQLFSVSSSAQKFCLEFYKSQSLVIPNVVDLVRYKTAYTKNKNPNQIIFLGRLVERKGCLQLLVAAKLLIEKNVDIQIIIAGDGPQRSMLEAYVKNNGLENKVKFLGFISEDDKPKLLAESAVACFPALYGESFGIVLIEAMAAGSGVVLGGNNPGYSTVLPEAYLFDPNNAKNLANLLEKSLSDFNFANQSHILQQELVKQYDVEIVGPKIVEQYRAAIEKRTSNRDN